MKQPCGHSIEWEVRSAETSQVLYCDICNTRSELSDALQMEARYKAERDVYIDALKSIAANTCCDSCREAALVARTAINTFHSTRNQSRN